MLYGNVSSLVWSETQAQRCFSLSSHRHLDAIHPSIYNYMLNMTPLNEWENPHTENNIARVA